MKAKSWVRFFILTMVLGSSALKAAPLVDRDVYHFLNSSTGPSQLMSVLITYKPNITLRNRPYSAKYHSEIEKALINSVRAQEEALVEFGPLQGANYRTYWIMNGTGAELNKERLRALMSHPNVASITNALHPVWIKRPMAAGGVSAKEPFTYGLQKINVPGLRQKYPDLTGKGVKVGILDTGIDPRHPDLSGKLLQFKDFTSAQSKDPSDGHGHGTHVAGTIAGSGTSGTSIGIAPQASLIIGKIFDSRGGSTDEQIVAGMQWMADPDGNPDTNDFPQLVSNSWGDSDGYADKDPKDMLFCQITSNWVKLGILPVFAAGNDGPSGGTVGTPGGCPMTLTVGATDARDNLAIFSSRGPAKWKTGNLMKPDLSAPGVDVVSSKPGGGYQRMSGTSMATPHVAGVMAILFQAAPQMTVDQAVRSVVAGVQDLGDTGTDVNFGAGRIDVLKSVDLMKAGMIR